MEQVIFAEAIWRAFAQCFLTHDEAVQAIDDFGRSLLHNALAQGARRLAASRWSDGLCLTLTTEKTCNCE